MLGNYYYGLVRRINTTLTTIISLLQNNPRHYQLSLGLLDPELDEHPVPCDCKIARCALFAALMQKEDDDFEEVPNIEDVSS